MDQSGAAVRRGSWYNSSGQQDGQQGQPGNFIGIDMSLGSSSSSSQQQQYRSSGAAGASAGPQYGSQQQQQVRKQPSTTQMYAAASASSPSLPPPVTLDTQRRNSGGSQMMMAMSPLTGRPGTSGSATYANDLNNGMGRMSYSPAMPGMQASSSSYAQNQSQSQNYGLGMQIGQGAASSSASSSQQYSPTAGFGGSGQGPTSPYLDYQQGQYTSSSQQQQQQQQRGRPSQLLTTQSYTGPASSSSQHNGQLKYNRTSSATSGLSLSTSPTTAGQASPLTPTSPVYNASSSHGHGHGHPDTFRVPAVPASSGGQHGQQYASQSAHARQQSINQYTLPPPDGMHAYASTSGSGTGYLEDPSSSMNGMHDRRQGSYSPSNYTNAYYQQQNTQNGGQYGSTVASTSAQPLVSPRNPGGSSAFYPNNSSVPSTSSQRQQALSPSYSRQQPQSAYPGSPPTSAGGAGGIQLSSRSSSVSSQYQTAGQTSHHSPSQPQGSRFLQQRPRSAASASGTGSAFRRVRDANDVQATASSSTASERRADPAGGTVSPLKALTSQLSQTYHLVNPNFRYEFSSNPRRVLTKPSQPAGNHGYDNEDSDYILYVNDVLGGEGNKYLILDVLGQGTFGQVVKCQNMKTMEIVGVKVIKNKPAYYHQSMMEIIILEMLNSNYDPDDKHHILRLKDTFPHQNHLCLVFELLSSNLYELIKQNAFRGLSTSLVRVFTEQLLDALCVLKDAKLIHCDLKPENILLKTLQSPDIKVIDFGSACHELQTVYTYIQSRFYRSPEVLLGLPYSCSIDMWSLGCICVELFLGLPLFPGTSEYNQICRIVEMLGMPPEHMLRNGKQVSQFFNLIYDEYGNEHWRLKSLAEYEREHPNAKEQPSKKFFAATTLPEIIKTYPNQRKGLKQADLDREMANRVSFIDFVTGLLNMDPVRRWTPQQAKMHPFVLNQPLKAPFVPPMGPSRLSSSTSGTPAPSSAAGQSERPYGGLQSAPRSSTRAYADAASYQRHLNQQQAQSAAFTANAFRQAQSTNPYAQQDLSPRQSTSLQQQQQQAYGTPQQQQQAYSVPRLPPLSSTAGRAPSGMQHTPSQSMSYPSSSLVASNALRTSTSGPLSPNIPMNPPPAHHYQPARNRAGTFSQLDVPPALQKLGFDLGSFKTIGTPQLRRDDQRAAWERRGHSEANQLDRRRSLRQANPHLEHLEYYAAGGGYPQAGTSAGAGGYYVSPTTAQQPFSIVVDPRIAAEQQAAVQMPPPAYAGQGGAAARAYANPASASGSSLPYDTFDSYDPRDGLAGMMHQPLVPTTQQGQGHRQQPSQSTSAYYGPPLQVGSSAAGAGYPGSLQNNLPYPGQLPMNGASSSGSGKQKRSDQQMWP